MQRKDLYIQDMVGCSDGGCIFQDNLSDRRMHTNGGCNCEKELMRIPGGLKAIRLIRHLRLLALTKENP